MKEKIGIISDTHGLLRPEVLESLKDCKYILHAGCGRSRFGGEVTMAVMTVEDGRYQVEKIILTENSEK